MFGSSTYTTRPVSPGPGDRRAPSPTPSSFSSFGGSVRRGSFSSGTTNHYIHAQAPSPAFTAARAASPVRPSSWATPRYIPSGIPPGLPTRPATPPSHRRRPSFDQSSPIPPRWAVLSGGKKLEIHGDSFVGVFEVSKPGSVRIVKHKGASAKGLNNPDSTLGVGQRLLKHIETTRPTHLLLMFAHVDIHLNYLWQLKARGKSALKPSEWVRSVVQHYTAFIVNQLLPTLGGTLYIAAVTPPVVEDHYLEFCIQKYTEKEQAGPLPPLSSTYHAHDMTTRQAMVRAYNQLLSTFCSKHLQVEFVSINRHLTAGGGEQVSSRFRDSVDPTNIHLLWERTISMWCTELPPLRGVSLKDPATLEQDLELFHRAKSQRMRGNSVTRGLAMR